MKKNSTLKNLKIAFYSFCLVNMTLNSKHTYISNARVITSDNRDIRIYDISSNSFNEMEISNMTEESFMRDSLHIDLFTDNCDLSFLANFSSLKKLEVYNLEGCLNLDFLKYVSDLEELSIYERKSYSNSNLNKIGNCSNIKKLSVNSPGYFDLSVLRGMPNLENLLLYNSVYTNLDVLSECNKLEKLQIKLDEAIPRSLFESIPNLKVLNLEVCDTCNINYQKLTFLDELNFVFPKSYTIAMDFTMEDLNVLKSNGVKVTAKYKNNTMDAIDEVMSIDCKLNEIVRSLNMLSTDTEQEKLDKILIYVIEHLDYDNEASNNSVRAYRYYEKGLLYKSIDSDKSICGNYAALVHALAKRSGLDSIYLQNSIHAWNLVKINGVYYGVDATFLDQGYNDAIVRIKNKTYGMDWYLIPLNKMNSDLHRSEKVPVLSSGLEKIKVKI